MALRSAQQPRVLTSLRMAGEPIYEDDSDAAVAKKAATKKINFVSVRTIKGRSSSEMATALVRRKEKGLFCFQK